jgi:hypothetical protein
MTGHDEQEEHRLRELAAAVSAAVSHANALTSTFQALQSQLSACISSLSGAFELMNPTERLHIPHSRIERSFSCTHLNAVSW